MREELEKLEGKRARFRGTFVRCGVRNGWMGRKLETVLLRDITNRKGDVVTDHLWFNLTKSLRALDPQPGEIIEFEARASPYWKGYRCWNEDLGLELDYKLAYPTRVRRYAPPKGQKTLSFVLEEVSDSDQGDGSDDWFAYHRAEAKASQNGVFCDKSPGGKT